MSGGFPEDLVWDARKQLESRAASSSGSVHQECLLIRGHSVAAAEQGADGALHLTELARVGSIRALRDELAQLYGVDPTDPVVLDGFIGASDEGDEEAEHHVDEETDEAVQVDLAEQPNQRTLLPHVCERHKHVVPIDEREQTLRDHRERSELVVIRAQHYPPAEAVTHVDDSNTAAEADHIRESDSESYDEDIVFLKET